MYMVTPQEIEEYFVRYGWTYSAESETTWITGVRTRVSAFRIMVRLTEHWVFFIINPLVVAPPLSENRLRLYYHALRYNLDMNFAKLGVDSDGDIFMAIEIPTENFVYSHFVDALDGISHHASMVYAELFGLGHNPDGTLGRYDQELAEVDEDSELGDNLPSHDAISALANLFSAALAEDDDEDDEVMIGGRRLLITDSGDGSPRIELEETDDSESDDSDELSDEE